MSASSWWPPPPPLPFPPPPLPLAPPLASLLSLGVKPCRSGVTYCVGLGLEMGLGLVDGQWEGEWGRSLDI